MAALPLLKALFHPGAPRAPTPPETAPPRAPVASGEGAPGRATRAPAPPLPPLTVGQQRAVEMAGRCVRNYGDLPRVSVLSGYAGTGKTTALRAISQAAGDKMVIVAPTGKAALRVREATGLRASTLHRWMYQPVENRKTGETRFERRKAEQIEVPPAGVVAVDEASMLTREHWDELYEVCTQLRLNILLIGDGFQLPPVSRGGERKPFSVFARDFPAHERVALTEVMRQVEDSPIVRAGTLVREGRVQQALAVLREVDDDELPGCIDELLAGGGVLLCHSNMARHRLNQQARERRGYSQELVKGEPLLVLHNSHELGRYNGELVTFGGWKKRLKDELDVYDRFSKRTQRSGFGIACVDEDQAVLSTAEVHGGFAGVGYRSLERTAKRAAKRMGATPAQASFLSVNLGYASTVHKAQGSEWPRALVYLEGTVRLREEDGRRWLYTAITRARHEALIHFA